MTVIEYLTMEQQHHDTAALIPKTTVFAKATELDLSLSDDKLDRFRKAGLLDDLVPIGGTTQRGFRLAQANRCVALLAICKVLGQRPKFSALAFWLCWYGFEDVPPDLICEHIDRTLLSYLTMLRRELDRKRVPINGVRDPKRWDKVGKPWGRFILKNYLRRAVDNPIAREVFSWTVGLVLRALISQTSFEAVATILQRVAYLVGIDKSKTDALREIWGALSDGVKLFTLDEAQNPLIRVVRQINATDPKMIIPLVHDARLTVGVMGAVFPVFNIAGAPLADDPKDAGRVYVAKHFAPGIVAVLALTRDLPHAISMRRNFREGNFQPALDEFYQVKVITSDMMRKLGIGAKE
jgi:hypothetical protein